MKEDMVQRDTADDAASRSQASAERDITVKMPEGMRVVWASHRHVDWKAGSERTWHATYVLYEHIRDYLALGWMVAIPNASCHINAYGVTMEWLCDCKPVRPAR